MSSPPLRLFFLWHFHQPWYLTDGQPASLPWLRLHALKDYRDIPLTLASEPRVPQVLNVVPSLLDQLERFAAGTATDALLEVVRRDVSDWSDADADLALRFLFSANEKRLIAPVPRYAELHARHLALEKASPAARRAAFDVAERRDLAVLLHLSWSGPRLRKDPLLARLLRKGRGFDEAEKTALLDRQQAYLGEVLPTWRALVGVPHVELSTTPYHHPILPLLLDTEAARQAVPWMPLPEGRFRHPGDARQHVEDGLATFQRHFGCRPGGMWPAEGSLSEAALELLAACGVTWVATDEAVLQNSIPELKKATPGARAATTYRPWRLQGRPSPALFFRDRDLSDRIGFTYQSWPAKAAVDDFVARLHELRKAAAGSSPAGLVVPVILDGENCWEHYEGNGEPFLEALLARLAAEDGLEVTTPSRVLAEASPEPLSHLVAGSWIDGTFRTWVGDPAKNRAWDLLIAARERLPLSPSLLAAEGSDWYWWFGEGNNSDEDAIFDALFRGHLETAYREAGVTPPAELARPVDPLAGLRPRKRP